MGGNVFPGKTRRYQAAEYFDLVPEVEQLVNSVSSRTVTIPAFRDKPSFGDMDVLFVPTQQLSVETLSDLFRVDQSLVSHNGGVWSIAYKEFQLDLITTTADEFDVALNYFSYNDFGNLRGRIHHKFGLKFGHDGLWFPVRSNDHVLGEVLLTRVPAEIDRFGDFVYTPDQLTDLESIFSIVAASRYFNPDIFLLENRNHTARIRDRKRATYTAFLDWCKTLPTGREYYIAHKDKTEYHAKIFEAFPNSVGEFNKLWEQQKLIEQAAELFNGDIVTKLTGRQAVELGEFMRRAKKYLTPRRVVWMSPIEVNEFVVWFDDTLKELKK